jgi:hypothetical protein
MTAVAAATMLTAVPAFAVPSLQQQTGPDLNAKIYASGDAGFLTTSNPAGSTQDQSVYGNTSPQAGHNVTFTGYTGFNTTTLTLGSLTSINITGGNGFAQIADANGVNPTGQNPNPSQNDLFALVMNPVPDFYLYEFSIQQFTAGSVTLYYDLAGGGVNWLPAGSSFTNGNGDTQYIFGDPNNMNLAIDSILILSGTAINHVKQNSIQTTGTAPLPEPATWAMMLLGFGGISMAMRRSRRRNGVLMQVA